jgi:predicted site-specific integrase-resolvase
MESKLLPPESAANYLRVKEGTLAVWRGTGCYKLPFVKVGRRVMYRIEDLDRFLEERTQTVA